MQNEEQKLIDNLFSRLQQAESQGSQRDSGAEQLIKQHLQSQPSAPYYMAQAILIQEAAMKKLNQRVSELETRLAQQPQQTSGGFLSGLFGGGNTRAQSNPAPNNWNNNAVQTPNYTATPNTAPPAARGSGFLGGALQTAVGVAGGVVMADMLTSMFHHSQPQEIVNIIEEQSPLETPNYDPNLETFNQGADQQWNDVQDNDSDSSFFDDSSFDDDTFI